MTKQPRSSEKKANSFGSMGRFVFYSIALVVACCAVAVVLFETEAGQELVAKVRGKESPNNGAKTKSTRGRHSVKRANTDSGEPKTAKQPEAAERELPREENVLSREDKATSPNPSDSLNEASESSRSDDMSESNEARQENLASETPSENDEGFSSEAEPHIDEATSDEKEDWEIIDEKIDEDEQDKPVEEQDKPVEEQEKPAEDLAEEREKPVEEQDKPVVELDKPVEEQDEPVHEQEKPVEEQDKLDEEPVFMEYGDQGGIVEETVPEGVNEVEENEQDDRKDEEKEVDGGEVEQEATITVGDSLAELEEQRSNEHLIVEEEPYEPIPEPEGPPIDQSPVNARRGLRGDYDCKDANKNCAGWAKLGECKKNAIWMEVNCKKSCKVCSCSDQDTKCVEWARTGECKKNPAWMNQNCMKSCEQC